MLAAAARCFSRDIAGCLDPAGRIQHVAGFMMKTRFAGAGTPDRVADFVIPDLFFRTKTDLYCTNTYSTNPFDENHPGITENT
jgi:hypothetical protein